MEKISDEIKVKIIEKIYGMVYVRSLETQDSKITIPEFRYIVGVLRIGRKDWFKVAKELEKDGIIKLHRNRYLEVLRNKAFVKG